MDQMIEEKENKYLIIIKNKINSLKNYRKQIFNMINIYDSEDKNFYLNELRITKYELYLLNQIIKEGEKK